jgi:hypothetical protein
MAVNWKIRVLGLGAAGLALCLAQPADAGCTVIAATNSGPTHASALAASQAAVGQQAQKLKQQYGWRRITSISARRVEPDPFWKAVRPVVPPEIIIKPDIRTGQAYTICWPGVVVPYVCTSGSRICGS